MGKSCACWSTASTSGALYPNSTTPLNSSRSPTLGFFFAGGTTHGFLLDGRNYVTLDVPGTVRTIARAVNDRGQIVGSFAASGTNHGFLLSRLLSCRRQ